jgi:hypothetical protein
MWRWLTLLTFTTILVACASDGGPSGTGIATSIAGNVVEVELLGREGQTTGDSVQVTIDELPGIEDETNEQGDFELVGDFSGVLTLRFTKLGVSAGQRLDVPVGSRIVLEDVAFGQHRVRVGSARQLGFFGTVAFVDCEAGDLLVDDRAPSRNQFLVRLVPRTIIVNGEGDLASCAALEVGRQLAIEGAIRLTEGSIEALTINIDPPKPGEPSPVVETSFAGTVRLINCQSGMINIEAETGSIRLRITEQSELLDADEQPIECTGITAGDVVDGTGLIRVRRPEVIDVLELHITPPGES